MKHSDVVVVGAGIIGLTSAFRLVQAGHSVTLIDPQPASGATFAAAGMIAANGEIAPNEMANYQRQLAAVPAWRALGDDLFTLTGETVPVVQRGTLLVGWDAGDRGLVEQYVHVANEFRAPIRPTSRSEWPEAFETISPRINDGIFIEGDAWIDPDHAVRLLLDALALLGVKIISDRVLRVGADDRGVRALTASGEFVASAGIIATGASGVLEGARSASNNVVRPVRGITIRVEGLDRSANPMVRAFVRGRHFYMVSRPGGYCVLGASAEERREAVIESGELQRLLRDALDVVPALETTSVLETRIGLRPASRDLQPFFEVLDPPRWAWSSGHYRHGVTLAPLSALDAVNFVNALD